MRKPLNRERDINREFVITMPLLHRVHDIIIKLELIIAGVCLAGMMLLTGGNILLRQMNIPVRGAIELMGYGGALVGALALSFAQQRKEHIAVTLLVEHYPPTVQRWINRFNLLLVMGFSILAGVRVCIVANTLRTTGEVSETLRMAFYPFAYGLAAGFILLALTLAIDIIDSFAPRSSETEAR